MKNLFKKSLLVLMVAFIAVFTLSVSSKVKATTEESTITFASKEQRTSFSSNAQVWSDGVVKFTNNKSKSTNAVADYANPVRLYANSNIVIDTIKENTVIRKIVFNANSASYATALKNSIGTVDSATVSVSSKVVTVTFNNDVKAFTIEKLTAQVRLDSIVTTTETLSMSDEHVCDLCERCGKCLDKNCTITEICGGHTLTITSTVSQTTIGLTAQLTASVNGFETSPVWDSSEKNVATVDQNGKVTPVGLGKTTITVTVEDLEQKLEFYVYPEAGKKLTIEEALFIGSYMSHNTYTDEKYYVEGTVTEVYQTTYGNMYITDGTNTFTIYGLYSADGSVRYDAMEVKPAANDKVTVYGVLGQYNGKPQIKDGWLTEHIYDENISKIQNALNSVEAKMSVAYKYTVTPIENQIKTISENVVVDTLNRETTGITSTSYAEWLEKKSISNAVWAGQSAGGNESIQLRSNNSNSGIITTASGGKVSKITITWNSNTTNGRTLDVYGKNTAYSSPTDLYNTSTQGTKLGSIVCGTSTELVVEGDYEYIALRSKSGAMYITSIEVEWTVESSDVEINETYSDVRFLFKCGIMESIENLVELPEDKSYTWGIEISDGTNDKYYTVNDNVNFIKKDEDNGINYVVIDIGDVLNNISYAKIEFTVRAYVEYDGQTYYSTSDKTYSVVSILSYYQNSDEVNLNDEQQESIDAVVEILTNLGC